MRVIAFLPPGGGGEGGTPYNDLKGVAPTESGTFFMSQVYERVGLLLVLCLAERFFSRCSGFPLSPKTNLSKLQFDLERTDTSLSEFLTISKCSAGKQITNQLFIANKAIELRSEVASAADS